MVLDQDCRHYVVLRTEIEQLKKVLSLFHAPHALLGNIDVRIFVAHGVREQLEIIEGEGGRIISSICCSGGHTVAVKHRFTDIGVDGRKGDIIAIGSATHGK